MVATVLLVGLLLVASATDLRSHEIYNKTTYPGMLIALGLNLVGSVLSWAEVVEPLVLRSLGWVGAWESLLGFLVCGVLLLICFVFLEVGGGDVKLMAMIGAFLGSHAGLVAMLWTFVLGACMGLIVLIWRVGFLKLISRVLRQVFWIVRLARWSPLTADERAELKPPLFLAPCALVAVLIVEFAPLTLV